jgi:hypothetical protein
MSTHKTANRPSFSKLFGIAVKNRWELEIAQECPWFIPLGVEFLQASPRFKPSSALNSACLRCLYIVSLKAPESFISPIYIRSQLFNVSPCLCLLCLFLLQGDLFAFLRLLQHLFSSSHLLKITLLNDRQNKLKMI